MRRATILVVFVVALFAGGRMYGNFHGPVGDPGDDGNFHGPVGDPGDDGN